MRKAVHLSLTAVVLAVAVVPASGEPTTFEFTRDGQWSKVELPATTQQTGPVPALERVERLLQQRKNKDARRLAIEWVLANKNHPQRDRGLFLIARALYQYGNRIRAFYYLDQLMDEYPDSSLYHASLELQYTIADRYLDGYKRRFLGMPAFHAYDEAIEMLYRIQNRSPGSQLAERALLRTANFYYNNRDYDFAADTYAAYQRTYPRSPDSERVKLRQAYSLYAQFRGPRFDATPVIDAREQLRSLAAQSPQLAAEENIAALIDQLDRNLARKLYVTGDFYRRTRELEGAAYTFRYLAEAYPSTPEAAMARKDLAALPPQAVASAPAPAISPGYAPPSGLDDARRMMPAAERQGSQQTISRPPEFR